MASCSCNAACYGYVACSCDATCHGYSACSCNNTTHGYSCTCHGTCYSAYTTTSRSCTCNLGCYHEIGNNCQCYMIEYGFTCPCNVHIAPGSPANCALSGYSCSCYGQCYGQGGYVAYYCSAYQVVQLCYCNSTEYEYSCTCHNSCYGYTACTCDNTCYGYTACTCDATCYLHYHATILVSWMGWE